MTSSVKSKPVHYIISDLHLMDRNEKFLFNFEKEAAFVRLVQMILEEKAHLILNGDIFDFTGMTPCRKGIAEFFKDTVPEEKQIPELIKKNSKFRTTRELLEDIRSTFPQFFEALSALARENRLVYIPGNHDCEFINSDSQKDFASILGVTPDKIQWSRQYHIGENLVVTHGNQYDPPNVTEKSCRNPGLIFTSALYTAVLPALQMLGTDPNIISAIPAVRPEENVIKDLQHMLSKIELQKILLGLTSLLVRNGYFRGISAIPGWFITREIPLISSMFRSKVTTDRLITLLPKDEMLMADARDGAKALFKQLLKEKRINDNTVIVLGHTHELDRAENYINLGTWLDHLRGLDPEEVATPEISLPVLKSLGPGHNDLIEFKNFNKDTHFNECPDI